MVLGVQEAQTDTVLYTVWGSEWVNIFTVWLGRWMDCYLSSLCIGLGIAQVVEANAVSEYKNIKMHLLQ